MANAVPEGLRLRIMGPASTSNPNQHVLSEYSLMPVADIILAIVLLLLPAALFIVLFSKRKLSLRSTLLATTASLAANFLLYYLDRSYHLPPELFEGCVDGPIETDMTMFLHFVFSFSFVFTFIWFVLFIIYVFKRINDRNVNFLPPRWGLNMYVIFCRGCTRLRLVTPLPMLCRP